MIKTKKNKNLPQNICTDKIKSLPLQRKNQGAIAQLVEQRTENPCVPGSIPGGTTAKESYRNVALFWFYTSPCIFPVLIVNLTIRPNLGCSLE